MSDEICLNAGARALFSLLGRPEGQDARWGAAASCAGVGQSTVMPGEWI